MAGEAADMHFVDDSSGGRPVERRVAFPIVGVGIYHHALHCHRIIITFFTRSFATVVLRNNRATSVGIKEDFGRIEAHSD